MTTSIDRLDLSVRACKALLKNGVTTREQLRALSREDLLAMPGIGPGHCGEIEEVLDPEVRDRRAALKQKQRSAVVDALDLYGKAAPAISEVTLRKGIERLFDHLEGDPDSMERFACATMGAVEIGELARRFGIPWLIPFRLSRRIFWLRLRGLPGHPISLSLPEPGPEKLPAEMLKELK